MSAADTPHPDENVVWHKHVIDKQYRAEQKKQRPALLWFTGLSGSGKSTVAGALESKLAQMGYHTYLLDGDNVRHGLCRDLGFSDHDRRENIRRVGEVAKLMTDAGLIVFSAFISPFREERRLVRELLPEGEFFEVFVDTPLEVCESRDPKGLYKKARAGEIKAFTGISSAYEAPETPEVHLQTDNHSVEVLVDQCIASLRQASIIG
ncbi:adenylyl-sulfate kinase [Grimontia marina]|uniref:Adenylyl-sulfate kinase n=1 Tax=Grimontia marina TaxID=646534 RepID=A0A128FAJ9_9GAMM|nr:adenylyl-sulfate kinase [Grimontia marina]CZF83535.1 Adenylyl-sulfate kinase [Grimontia marina]